MKDLREYLNRADVASIECMLEEYENKVAADSQLAQYKDSIVHKQLHQELKDMIEKLNVYLNDSIDEEE